MNILYYKSVFHMHREMFKSNHEKTNEVFEKTVRYNQQINNHKFSPTIHNILTDSINFLSLNSKNIYCKK